MLAQVATQRGIVENIKDDAGEPEGPAEPAAPLRDEAVTGHGFNVHASLTIAAEDDLGRERLCRYGLRPPFSLSRFRMLRDGRISYRVKKSARRSVRCRIMTPVECIARLCALVPLHVTRSRASMACLAPRAKLRSRIVPQLPPHATPPCASSPGDSQGTQRCAVQDARASKDDLRDQQLEAKSRKRGTKNLERTALRAKVTHEDRGVEDDAHRSDRLDVGRTIRAHRRRLGRLRPTAQDELQRRDLTLGE